ncbi:hypothetical protein GQR58_007233 [Nymphon striatum]|nr:hypothetical protein GQR58_007233 [Nymphon striatum]
MPLPESEEFNVNFVRVIESLKCLYDPTLPDYSSKETQDQAWSHVAEMFSATAIECKLRWKYLRGGLTRYIKKQKEKCGYSAKVTKPFYLLEEMQFVLPYLKSRTRSSTSSRPHRNEDPDNIELYFDKFEVDSVHETSREDFEISDRTEASPTLRELDPSPIKRIKTAQTSADDLFERSVPNYICEDPVEILENPDLHFFKSILPDMASLNPSQKRRFKVKVLQLLDEIANEETVPRSSSMFSMQSSSPTEYR